MKKIILLFLLISSFAQAQYSVKGTMTPPHSNDWVILYKIEGARQIFINNTTVKKDTILVDSIQKEIAHFEFELPENTKTGSYRVTYALEGEGFLDFLFNKEDVSFTFNPMYPEQTVVYSVSKENKLYKEYIEVISNSQQKLDSIQGIAFQKSTDSLAKIYQKVAKSIQDIQQTYLEKSKNRMVHHFIKATLRNNSPEIITSQQDYFPYFIGHFFDNMDFSDAVLQNSSFLTDRITNYIFDLSYSEDVDMQQKLYKKSIAEVLSKISDLKFKKDVLEFLITQFGALKNVEIVAFLIADYYQNLPETLQNEKFTKEILTKLAVEIGRTAPDFSWKENGKLHQLSTLKDGEHYVLVFWSSGCSHCLREIPKLHNYLKDNTKVKVVAFGMEEEKYEWQNYIQNLKGWHHVLGLGKWKNKTAKTYQVFSTPTYLILDADKKIVAKPEGINDVKTFFETQTSSITK